MQRDTSARESWIDADRKGAIRHKSNKNSVGPGVYSSND